ncbi:MAG: hypothetical protein HY303_02100 [Candidatus Wallbacteria bacterium]|nr:hypothetical protein [Candidatus Wallbacteria bacterium]
MDSIAYLAPEHSGAIVCCGSHGGLSAAEFASRVGIRAVVFNDAGLGKDGAGVQGVHWLAEKGIAAAAVSHHSARIGDGLDCWENGRLSTANRLAAAQGLHPGLTVREAVALLTSASPGSDEASGPPARPAPPVTPLPVEARAKRKFTSKVSTAIWKEEPDATNAFLPVKSLCFGYDFYGALLGERSFVEMLFLLYRGELPSRTQSAALDILLASVMNPGPRHLATRAAMNGSIGGTSIGNCLVAGLGPLQGEYFGSQSVMSSAEMLCWLRDAGFEAEADAGRALAAKYPDLPGFGLFYSGRDDRARLTASRLESQQLAGPALSAALLAERCIGRERSLWLILPGVFAAGCVDLGFSPEQAAGAFLLAVSAGLLAHATEQRARTWNEYPIYWDPKLYCYKGHRPPGSKGEGE